jgi:tetratricopeptide (TPR) repeat protein
MPQQPKAEPSSDVETTPLQDHSINPVPLQELRPVEPIENNIPPAPIPNDQSSSEPPSENTQPPQSNNEQPPAPKPPVIVEVPPAPVVEEHQPMPFEPYESTAANSPAVGVLLADANKNSKAGDLDVAVTTIERAIRIEPRNPNLYYKLAVIRLKQSKPRLAEDLAKKSALLASTNMQLKKHSWLLVAKAREIQKDYDGSKQAIEKANSF